LKTGGLSIQNADLMVENCIGKVSIPVGLGLNFLINGTFYTIPMATEEPSVIAAASSAAKLISEKGSGFKAYSSRPVMMG
jgi:hydroxymethylglutaryl-CoA synthase